MSLKKTIRNEVMTILSTMTSRRCPRCRGILSLECDTKAGYTRDCLNCGYVEYLDKTPVDLDVRRTPKINLGGRSTLRRPAATATRR